MKERLVSILQYALKQLSRLTIWRFRPGIIGVTGSVGKTSAKIAIASVVGQGRTVRFAKGNLNNTLGLPLAILGSWTDEELRLVSREQKAGERILQKIAFWIKVIVMSVAQVLFGKKSKYPEILVLEYGADHPGDLRELLQIARPNVSVITAVGEIPVHVEFYAGPEEVAREKARLIECLPSASFAILNADDERVMKVRDRTRAHVMTFGFSEDAEVRISGFEHRVENGKPAGISFKIEHGGSFVPVRLDGALGQSHAYAAAAAACAGLIFGSNLVTISEALSGYAPAHSRMELVEGIKGSLVIDDAYNASLLAVASALQALGELPGTRKVAILGDMLELGAYALPAHEKVGKLVERSVDMLVTVGPRAKFIADSAHDSGMSKRAIKSFETAEEAKSAVHNLIKKGDLVLVKGSRGMHLEIIVEEITEPKEVSAILREAGKQTVK
jgi:UDP-N-acetylmuramoyl-tripeptide--D-alanyl-D-alanine ligase